MSVVSFYDSPFFVSPDFYRREQTILKDGPRKPLERAINGGSKNVSCATSQPASRRKMLLVAIVRLLKCT